MASAMAALPEPSTPQLRVRRRLFKSFSDAKEPDAKRPCTDPTTSAGPASDDKLKASPGEVGNPAEEAALLGELESCGVPAEAHDRLLPLLRRWGPARTGQVLGLWTRLGDGGSRPASTATLQVWGPAGVGKTEVVFGYLGAMRLRHVRLNCACFSSAGELHARLAEGLRAAAVEALQAAGREVPKDLQQRQPLGRQLRTLDRLEAAVRLPLESLAQAGDARFGDLGRPVKVFVVLDHAQELQRLGAGVLDLLLTLPEVLKRGEQIAVVTISRLPLGCLGVPAAREPPGVAFRPYTEAEAEALLLRRLPQRAADAGVALPAGDAEAESLSLCTNGLMKFAVPYVGCNLQRLLRIGEESLRQPDAEAASAPGRAARRSATDEVAQLQERVDAVVQQFDGPWDLGGLLEPGERADVSVASAMASMRRMTKAQKRLLLAAYLASRIDKEDDQQLFVPTARRRMRKRPPTRRRDGADEQPVFTKAPKPVPLLRLLAVYHHLARQPQLLGLPLFEHLMNLREAGLLRFVGDRGPGSAPGVERDPKVVCRAELPLVRACAGDLDIDLAEYLCSF